MWAITMVAKPERVSSSRKSESSAEPITTSGVVSGSTSSRSTAELPRNR